MSDTTFVDGSTLTAADWFNDVNRLHYTIFGDPANAAAARTTFLTYSGTYTPTLTSVTNVDGSTAVACQYMRVGSTVTVSGSFNMDATATGATELGISLPVASNFANSNECGGVGCDQSLSIVGAIAADTANDRARFLVVVTQTNDRSYSFSFTYQII